MTDEGTNGKFKRWKAELLTDKNSLLVLVDYQPSMLKSIGSGDKSLIMSAVVGAAKAANILKFLLFCLLLILKRWGSLFRKLAECFRIRKYSHGKFRVLMLLKMKKPGTLPKSWIGKRWSFHACGQVCALHIQLYML